MHDVRWPTSPLLMHYVAAMEGVERIRFTTSHPVEFTDALIEAYAEVPKLVSHLHLPVQSGSDRVLALMKRGHTGLPSTRTRSAACARRPDISLSSDFIVGFPGETDETCFAATMALIRDCRLRPVVQLHLQPAAGHAGRGADQVPDQWR
jgi:tRNA-2-methylthio-N6-dimethylallyladenosine synthase